jgi:hypothetical protein
MHAVSCGYLESCIQLQTIQRACPNEPSVPAALSGLYCSVIVVLVFERANKDPAALVMSIVTSLLTLERKISLSLYFSRSHQGTDLKSKDAKFWISSHAMVFGTPARCLKVCNQERKTQWRQSTLHHVVISVLAPCQVCHYQVRS